MEQIARWPLITYDNSYTSGSVVVNEFRRHGVTPWVVMRAMDASIQNDSSSDMYIKNKPAGKPMPCTQRESSDKQEKTTRQFIHPIASVRTASIF